MSHIRKVAGIALGALVASAAAIPAMAGESHDVYPETPKTNKILPLVNTYHGSDHLKANILNPSPVCNSSEDYRTTAYKVTQNFVPAGSVKTTNNTNKPISLSQDLSRSQSIDLSINGSATESIDVSLGGDAGTSKDGTSASISPSIGLSISKQLGVSASYSLSWNVGQTIGPYEVPAAHTGEATYGFRTMNITGTQQHCKPNGTWSNPVAWRAMIPVQNEIRVSLYDRATGAITGSTDSLKDNLPKYDIAPADVPKAVEGVDAKDYDLQPSLTVSDAKAVGFAGSVAVHVKNVGNKEYYKDISQPTRFLVKVKTEKGPKGVDRLITTTNHHGAYARDLGFDRATSTRTFEVTLSNPIEPGEDQVLTALSFGDGLTKKGRLVNSIEVTQIGRIDGDVSTDNDQNVSSKTATLNDFGKPAKSKGLF
ncbi:hypothetical protein [Cutibacterium sp.]|uniref:hypothetical protein n=1 Tax=Cutibacterium sp. TaxID=1912221 RepID=UPI0026DCB257|nr:hypothetical protein [Cutibacterium sp.]MDO4413137.1 hypothetical protein [Cutibacterium sp.]